MCSCRDITWQSDITHHYSLRRVHHFFRIAFNCASNKDSFCAVQSIEVIIEVGVAENVEHCVLTNFSESLCKCIVVR